MFANAGWKWSDAVSTRLSSPHSTATQLPGALTRAEVGRRIPNRPAPRHSMPTTARKSRLAAPPMKTTWNINATSALDVGLSYEKQDLYHPIVERILVDFDGPGPNPPVEVFSLLVDTDHRDTGASCVTASRPANTKCSSAPTTAIPR